MANPKLTFTFPQNEEMKAVFTVNMTPSKLSQLENDMGFVTKEDVNVPDMSSFVTIDDLEAKKYLTEVPNEYVTETELVQGLESKQPKGDYALKTDIPNTSNFATKNEIPIDYVTDVELSQGLETKQPKGNYALKSEIPDTSDFALKSELPDTSDFITMTEVETYAYDKSTVDELIANSGSGSSGGGGATWGSITGALSDQTDLQTVLDKKLENQTTKGYSLAIGKDTSTEATQTYSVAIGVGAKAKAQNTIAIGYNTTSNSGIVIGRGTSTTNSASVAIAGSASASNAIAIGLGSYTSGQYGIGLGDQITVSGKYGIGIGYNADATAENAIQIGTGTNSTAKTMQVMTFPLLDLSTGKIPSERLDCYTKAEIDALLEELRSLLS